MRNSTLDCEIIWVTNKVLTIRRQILWEGTLLVTLVSTLLLTTYWIAIQSTENDRVFFWPNMWVPSCTFSRQIPIAYHVSLTFLILIGFLLVRFGSHAHDYVKILAASEDLDQIRSLNNIAYATSVFTAVALVLTGCYPIDTHRAVHNTVSMIAFFGICIYGLVHYLAAGKQVLKTFLDHRMYFVWGVLVKICMASVFLLVACMGILVGVAGNTDDLISKPCEWRTDKTSYIAYVVFFVSEMTIILGGMVMVGLILPRALVPPGKVQ